MDDYAKFLLGVYVVYAIFIWLMFIFTATGPFSSWWYAPTILCIGVPAIAACMAALVSGRW